MAKIKEVFNVKKLNPHQEETIKNLLEQKDVFPALRIVEGNRYVTWPFL